MPYIHQMPFKGKQTLPLKHKGVKDKMYLIDKPQQDVKVSQHKVHTLKGINTDIFICIIKN